MKRKLSNIAAAIIMSTVITVAYCPVGFAATDQTYDPTQECQTQEITSQKTTDEDSAKTYSAEDMVYINPMYRDIVSEDDIEKQKHGNFETMDIDQSIKYYDNVNDAGDAMISQLKSNRESCKTGIVYDSYDEALNAIKSSGICTNAIKRAMRHTGDPTGGDYIMWQYKGYSASSYIQGPDENDKYYVKLSYKITYFTTEEQETQTTTAVNSILKSLALDGKTDVQKVTAIYNYLCKNVKYDYSGGSDSSNNICHSAYSAAVLKKTVCQGYALLFYRLALTEGIDARVYVAYSKSSGHAWNIVKLDGKYYYLDATWDAGVSSYKYFLKGTSDFAGHGGYTDVAGPQESYNMSTTAYVTTGQTVTLPTTSLKGYKAKKKGFTVYWYKSSNKNVEGYQIRYSIYSSFKKYSTKAFGNTSSGTRTGLKKKKRYYVQVRTYRKIPGTSSYQYSSWSAKKSLKTK